MCVCNGCDAVIKKHGPALPRLPTSPHLGPPDSGWGTSDRGNSGDVHVMAVAITHRQENGDGDDEVDDEE